MNKQLISIISITFSIVLAIGAWLYFSKIDDKRINPILAVPDNMALAIETDNSHQRLKQLSNPEFMEILLMNENLRNNYQNLLYLDSLIQENSIISNWFNTGKAVYSIHTFENASSGILLSLQTLEDVDPELAQEFFQRHFPGRFKVSKRKFVNEQLYDFTDFKSNFSFTIGFRNKLMFFSPNGNLVELAIVKVGQLNNTQIAEDKLSFVRKNGNGILFHINYKLLGKLIKNQTQAQLALPFDIIGDFAERAAYEVEIEEEELLLKGAAITHETNFQFLDLLNAQAPIKNNLTEQLPAGLNYAFVIGFNGYRNWHKNVQEYLMSKGLHQKYKSYADSIEKNFQIKFVEKLPSYFNKHVALLSSNEPGLWKDSCYVLAIELSESEKALALLTQMEAAWKLKNVSDSIENKSDSAYLTNQCHLGDVFKYYFTDLFEGFSADYYIYHAGYIYFANNPKILKRFQEKWRSKKLLIDEPNYNAFAKKMVSASNLELSIYNDHAPKYALNFLTEDWLNLINRNMGTFKRAQYTSIQFAGSNDKVFATQCNIRFNTNKPEKNEQIWEIQIDTGLVIAPFIVQNANLLSAVVLIQDLKNQLYMIDREGKELWKYKLDGPILSDIKELDIYKNGRKYYAFNTSKQIYLIDENGKNLAGWPAWIPTGTKYPVAIIDPNQDKNFIFVATGQYYKVSAFSAQGRLLPGWNPKEVYPNLVQTLTYLRFHGQGLLAALNEQGYISYYTMQSKSFNGIPKDSSITFIRAVIAQKDTGTINILAEDSIQSYQLEISSTRPLKQIINPTKPIKAAETIYPIPVFGPVLKGNIFNEADEWMIFADEANKLKMYHLR